MSTTNGVIQTSSGDLLRAGFCNFSTDGSFNSGTESYMTTVPDPAYVKGQVGVTNMHRWSGNVWSEVTQP